MEIIFIYRNKRLIFAASKKYFILYNLNHCVKLFFIPSKFLQLPVLLLLLTTTCLPQNHPLHWKSWTTPVTDMKDIYFIAEKEGWAIG
jgi:hypothetical protein